MNRNVAFLGVLLLLAGVHPGARAQIPVVSKSAIAFGETVSGKISLAGGIAGYSLSGTAGQRVYLDGLEPDNSGLMIMVISPSGKAVWNVSAGRDGGLQTLEETGVYQVLVDGVREATGEYQFRILDVAVGQALVSGKIVNGVLAPQRQSAVYYWKGIAGQKLKFDSIASSSTAASWEFYGPADQVLLFGRGFRSDLGEVVLPTDGTCVLVVSGNGSGSLSFSYQFEMTSSQESKGEAVGFGQIMEGTLSGGTNRFTVQSVAGQWVYLDSQDRSSGGVAVDLRRSDGVGGNLFAVGASADSGPYLVPTSAAYDLVVRGTGKYRLRLIDLTALKPVVPGLEVKGDLEIAQTEIFAFEGAAGMRIFYDALDAKFDPVAIRLLTPAGNIAFVNGNADSDVGVFSLGTLGRYYWVNENVSNVKTDFRFRYFDVDQVPFLELGKPLTGLMEPPTGVFFRRFAAKVGEKWFFDGRGTNGGGWSVTGPRNEIVAQNSWNSDLEFVTQFDAIHLLGVGGAGREPATYDLLPARAGTLTTPLILGVLVQGEIKEAGVDVLYEFDGSPGQRLFYDGIEWFNRSTVRLRAPSGVDLFHRGLDADFGPFTLAESGRYQLMVEGAAGNIGAYQFRLLDVASLPARPLVLNTQYGAGVESVPASALKVVGSYVAKSLRAYAPQDDWRQTQVVAGTRADARIHFPQDGWGKRGEVGLSGGTDENWESYSVQWDGQISIPPGGARLYTRSDDGSRLWVDLNGDGKFDSSGPEFFDNNWGNGQGVTRRGPTVRIPAGTYTFRLQYEEEFGGNEVFLEWEAGQSLDPGTMVQAYRYEGRQGERLFFNGLFGSFGGGMILYGPANEVFNNVGLAGNFEITLPRNGPYTLFVYGGNTPTPVPFAFSVNAFEHAVEDLRINERIEGSILRFGDQHHFRFSASVGQKFFFDAQSNQGGAVHARLLGPGGESVFEVNRVTDRGPMVIGQTGAYTLVLDGIGATLGDYAFRWVDLDSGLVKNLEYGRAYGFSTVTAEALDVIGTYINTSLRAQPAQDDWRVSQPVAGKRADARIDFNNPVWGDRATVGLTKGSDDNWEDYSVQWDGTVRVLVPNTRFYTASDDGSRLWLDLDGNGQFGLSAPELTDNNWGVGQSVRVGPASVPVQPGVYRMRAQYEEGFGGNEMRLYWDQGEGMDRGNQAIYYRIRGKAGDRLYIDMTGPSTQAGWGLYEPTGRWLTGSNLTGDSAVTLPGDGEYFLLLDGNVEGPVPYGLRVTTVQVAQVPLALGQVVKGSIANPGDEVHYLFDAVPGQRVVVDWLSPIAGGAPIRTTLSSPTTGDLGSWGPSDGSVEVLKEAGKHRLKLFASGAWTGEYEFRLLDLGSAPPMSLGANVVGALVPGARMDVHRFGGKVGQRLRLTGAAGTDTAVAARLVSPSGGVLDFGGLRGRNVEFALAESGDFAVTIGSDNNAGISLAYAFQVTLVEEAGGALAGFGELVSGTVSGGTNRLNLEGVAGRLIYFDSQSATSTGVLVDLREAATGGENLFTINSSGDSGPHLIPRNGRLVLQVRGSGAYKFKVLDFGSAPLLPFGEQISGDLDLGEARMAGIVAVAGQRLMLDALDSDFDAVTARLYGPDGRVRHINGNADTDSAPFQLEVGGRYTLVIDNASRVRADFRNRLLDLSQSPKLESGLEVRKVNDSGLGMTAYQFQGLQGQRWYFDSLGTNGGDWRIYGPQNNLLSQTHWGADMELLLPGDGTYCLVLDGRTPAPAGYAFRALLAGVTTEKLALNTIISGSIALPGDRKVHEFAGVAGQRLYFDGLKGFPSGVVRLQDAESGTDLFALAIDNDRGPVTLGGNGVYRIVIDGSSGATGEWAFRLIDVGTQPELTFNREAAGTIDPGLGAVVYKVLATAGQKLFFDGLGSEFAGAWHFYGPGNVHLGGNTINRDFEINAAQTGVYLLILSGNTEKPVSYKFSLNVATIPDTELELGTAVKGVLERSGDQAIYKFKGFPGQKVFFDSILAEHVSMRVRLLAPSGATVRQSSAQSDFGPLTLAESGVFAVVIDGTGDARGGYAFQMFDIASQPVLRYNTVFEGVVDPPTSARLFRVAVTGKERLYFNGQGSDAGAYWTLYGVANETLGGTSLNNDFEYLPARSAEYTLVLAGDNNNQVPVRYVLSVNASSIDQGANTSPTLTEIQDQVSVGGRVLGPISFVVADAETPLDKLTVVARSSDQSVLPDAAFKLEGTGARRGLTITPPVDGSGSALVTISVIDEQGARSSRTFQVVLSAKNTLPSISEIADQITREGKPSVAIKFVVGDLETTASRLQLAASTSNPELLPKENIVFGGLGANRTATLYPLPGKTGTAKVEILVFDFDGGSVTTTFSLAVAGASVGIQTQPASQTVRVGDDAKFGVVATGSRPITYQWRFNGVDIPGARSSVLIIERARADQAGVYTVVVGNPSGSVSSVPVRLGVLVPPSVSTQPRSQSVALGASVTFSIVMNGAGPFKYQWRLNGVNIPGANDANYSIPSVGLADSGTYRVAVSTESGTLLSDPAALAVSADSLELTDAFAARNSLNSLSGTGRGANVRFTLEPGEPRHGNKAGGRSAWIQWVAPATGLARFDTRGSTFDTVLAVYSGDALARLVLEASDDDSAGFSASRVRFNAQAGVAYSVAVDGVGGGQGQVVLNWELTPAATRLPVITGQPQTVVSRLGGSAVFTVTAVNPVDALNPILYRWFFNGTAIPGASASRLTVDNIQLSNLGDYFVEVSNPSASVTSQSARLQVNLSEGDTVNAKVTSEDKLSDAVLFLDPIADVLLPGPTPLERALGQLQRPRRSGTAVARGYSGSQIFHSFGSSTEEGEPQHCGVIGGASQWTSYTPEADGLLTLTTDGSAFDTVLAVYTGNSAEFSTLIPVACDNNSGLDGQDSKVVIPVTRGTVYYIAVDGVNGAIGTATLTYRLEAPARFAPPGLNNGTLQFDLSGLPGGEYTIEWTSGFQTWTPLITTNAVNGVVRVVDPNAQGSVPRFYRAVTVE